MNPLLTVLADIAAQLKRIADQGEPAIITTTKREIEVGRAEYGNRQQREQTEEFHTALTSPPPPEAGAKAKSARRGKEKARID